MTIEDYQLQDCDAMHSCNHPHLGKGQKGWCIGKEGHKGIHRCGRCGSTFHLKETYTREEILRFINERIAKYERLARVYPSQSRQYGYKIDELVSITSVITLL